MPRIALLSTSDTDLLSARERRGLRLGQSGATDPPGPRSSARGCRHRGRPHPRGPQDLCSGFRRIAATGTPMVVLGGEQAPMPRSWSSRRCPPVWSPRRIVISRRAARTTCATCTPSSPTPCSSPVRASRRPPSCRRGVCSTGPRSPLARDGAPRPRVGVLFYRAQQVAGNTAYAHALCDAIDEAGGVGVPIHAASLRDAPDDLIAHLGTLDALVATVLAAGGTKPATASAGRTTRRGTCEPSPSSTSRSSRGSA